jgi:hypothetical protein
VVDLASPQATVKHELKTLRKPLAATILDDGELLAVVSSRHQVNIYRLSRDEARHIQALTLDNVPRALALSPAGTVLAVAYEGGIEVYALGENALATQRRAVRCIGVDSISFSSDGAMLLGSSADHQKTGMVTISLSCYTEMVAETDSQSQMWTTQILFPEITSDFSHVSLLPVQAEGDGGWIVGFDSQTHAFRAVKTKDSKTGSTYFVNPTTDDQQAEEPRPIAVPAAHPCGDLVALTFQGRGIWLYGLPDNYDLTPNTPLGLSGSDGDRRTSIDRISNQSVDQDTDSPRVRRIINQSYALIQGHQVADIPGITAARWIAPGESVENHSTAYRLVAVAPGGVSSSSLGEEVIPVDGGRLAIFDFERSAEDGETVETTVVVGEATPKLLKEQSANLDVEVELERRRTQLHRGEAGSPRNTIAERIGSTPQTFPSTRNITQRLPVVTPIITETLTNSPSTVGEEDNNDNNDNNNNILDAPYSNTQPRSRDSLYRAASAAAATRERYNPRNTRYETEFEQQMQDNDSDGWIPPPPPYSRDADEPLPEHLRRLLVPTMTEPLRRIPGTPLSFRRARTAQPEESAENERAQRRLSIRRINALSASPPWRRNFRDIPTTESATQVGRLRRPLPPGKIPPPMGPTDVNGLSQLNITSTTTPAISTLQASQAVTRPRFTDPLTSQPLNPPSLQERMDFPLPPLPQPESNPRAPPIRPFSQLIIPQVAVHPVNTERRASEGTRGFYAPNFSRVYLGDQGTPSNHRASESPARVSRNHSPVSNRSFTVSLPDLSTDAQRSHMEILRQNAQGRPKGPQGVQRRRSRSEGTPSSMRLTPENLHAAAGRSVSADTIDRRLRQNAEGPYDWRHRIEQWNIQTVNEQKKKSRTKCLVM